MCIHHNLPSFTIEAVVVIWYAGSQLQPVLRNWAELAISVVDGWRSGFHYFDMFHTKPTPPYYWLYGLLLFEAFSFFSAELTVIGDSTLRYAEKCESPDMEWKQGGKSWGKWKHQNSSATRYGRVFVVHWRHGREEECKLGDCRCEGWVTRYERLVESNQWL